MLLVTSRLSAEVNGLHYRDGDINWNLVHSSLNELHHRDGDIKWNLVHSSLKYTRVGKGIIFGFI
jgi:hypothetical protein